MTERRQLFKRNFQASITNLSIGKKIDIEGLRITFKITKTNKARGNTATCAIYNLSPINRKTILTPNTKSGAPQTKIEIRAGYGTESKLIFTGVGTASTQWDAPNYVSTVVANDSFGISSAPFENIYPKNYLVDTIIDDLIRAVGLPRGTVEKIGAALKQSRSFSGMAESQFEDLASTYGFTFDIQNGKVNVFFGRNREKRSKVFLGKDSGMIGSPYWDGSIVKVRSLIIAEILPNNLVTLEVEDVQLAGQYTVLKVVIKGDNWGSNAVMEIELAPRGLESFYDNLLDVGNIV